MQFKLSLTIVSVFFCLSAMGQKNYMLKFEISDRDSSGYSTIKISEKDLKFYRDTLQIYQQIENQLSDLKASGYISCGIDSIKTDSLLVTAYLYAGLKYSWSQIKPGNVPDDFLSGTGFNKKLFTSKPIRADQITALHKRIIKNCENNGYPFASVKLDSIEINSNQFSATLSLEKNKYTSIDSIILKGNANVAPVYLYNYIGIFPGDEYNENQIRKISSRLRELPFIKEIKPSQVLFTQHESKLYLFLENKKASQFDGVLGLLPDEKKTGKFNFTGEVHLKLQNSLKRGEVIELNWKQLPSKSQDLKVHALYPFLFNTRFGLDGNLAIFKKDSTYIDVTKNLGVQYALTGNNYIKAFVTDKESDLQTTIGLENISILPPYADISTLSYGLTFHYEKLDYRLNPRKGFYAEATGSTGNRKILRNSGINSIVYDSIKLNSVTYMGEISFDYYFPLGGRHVIDLGNKSSYIYNPELFVNEVYRIGGLKSLRGFDEESIYASAFTIVKMEYRYLLEQNSFLFVFLNGAWYENKSRNLYIKDKPIGFGAGINFETKLGIMSVSYALGKQFDNPVYFRNGKIHFGIVNYF